MDIPKIPSDENMEPCLTALHTLQKYVESLRESRRNMIEKCHERNWSVPKQSIYFIDDEVCLIDTYSEGFAKDLPANLLALWLPNYVKEEFDHELQVILSKTKLCISLFEEKIVR